MDNPLINVDIKPLADVINKLIEKISSAVGWVATRDTPKKEAVRSFIKNVESSSYDPFEKAALISNASKVINEYCNQNDILKIACGSVKEDAKPKEIEDDWIAKFMDYAKDVSDKDFQQMWGRLLAEECNHPATVPKRLLHILSVMDKEEARGFLALKKISIYTESGEDGVIEYAPVIGTGKAYLEKYDLNFDKLVNLQALGLITIGTLYMYDSISYPICIKYFDEEQIILGEGDLLPYGNVAYTGAGQVLCRIIETEKIDGFLKNECIQIINKYQKMIEKIGE